MSDTSSRMFYRQAALPMAVAAALMPNWASAQDSTEQKGQDDELPDGGFFYLQYSQKF
jgi:hypothetical protein